MIVEELALQDFRNYERAHLELAPGMTLITGRNAQGKTNLLEAIYCLSGLGSPRTTEPVLVRAGADTAYLHGRVRRGERRVEIDLEIKPGRGSRALLNKAPAPGAKALGEVLAVVFFGPDDLALVKGSPEGRRRFLDDVAVKVRPAADGLRKEWERVLRQRNSLLKTAPRAATPPRTLAVWDDAFCRAGAAMGGARLRALARLVPQARARFHSISGGDRLTLSYESTWLDPSLAEKALEAPDTIDEPELEASLRAALEAVRGRELERGMSLVGPQRDDVAIALESDGDRGGPRDARSHASQGEQRSCALSLKLGEFDVLEAALGDEPVLLLDDVFSELDPARREWLADSVRGRAQTVVSSAESGAIEAARADRIFDVVAGRLERR